jgi:hypothetical protein
MKAKMEPKPKLTSAAGIAVGDNRNRLVAGPLRPRPAEFLAPVHRAAHEAEPYTRV